MSPRLRPPGRSSRWAAALLATAALPAAPTGAVVYVMPTDESMVDRSPIIVFGEVRSSGSGDHRGRTVTNYVLEVEEALKGDIAGTAIAVRQPGGVDDDGVASWIVGLPMLAEGDRVLLFLRERKEDAHDIVEYALGMFWEVDADGGPLLLRAPSLENGAPPTGEPAEDRSPRDGPLFRRWIADRAAGLARPADYFAAEPPDGLVGVASPYRLWRLPGGQEGCHAGNEGLLLRWLEFDRGESLGFVVHSGGQPGVPGGGLRQVLAGMMAWNNDAGSRVALAVLGETRDLLRLSEPDGALSIMYEDPHDEIEGRFGDDGEKSGVLAVTKAIRATCASHRIPGGGEEAVALTETGIATQDGLGDYLRSGEVANPANFFERVIAHELGHSIAIGHPCEPDEADCNDAHPHRGALMYPTTGESDASRARLHADDRAAVRRLYPSRGGDQPEPPPSPGPDGCTPTTTALRFDGGYRVSMCYGTPQGDVGQAKAGVWASGQAGILWFFDRENAEVLVKVLDGCAVNGHRWAFVAPVTDLEFNLWITGPGGRRWTHSNTQGRTAATKSDNRAFQCANEG